MSMSGILPAVMVAFGLMVCLPEVVLVAVPMGRLGGRSHPGRPRISASAPATAGG